MEEQRTVDLLGGALGSQDKKLRAIELIYQMPMTGETYAQIAEKVGISERQFRRWRTEDRLFMEEFSSYGDAKLSEMKPVIIDSLGKYVGNKDYKESTQLKALELLMKSQGMLKEVRSSNVRLTSTEERAAEVQALINSYGID